MNRIVLGSAVVVGTAAGFAAWTFASVAPPGGSTVYTANQDNDSASVLRQADLVRVRGDITGLDYRPQAVSVARDGSRVYIGNDGDGDGSITVIDGTTNSFVRNVLLSNGSTVSDIVVAPDGTKVYATLVNPGIVSVMDTTSFVVSDPIPVPTVSSSTPSPIAIDISADGLSLFVLNTADSRLVKMSASDGESEASAGVGFNAKEVRVSTDGATVVVVGDDAPQFFKTSDLSPVAGADTTDYGSQVDVAAAGTKFYVLNTNYFPAPSAAVAFRPKGVLPSSGPSIDVYNAATGSYDRSFFLGTEKTVLGITVLQDASQAIVTFTALENDGSAVTVDLTDGSLDYTGPTGPYPRRVAVNEIGATAPVVSFFLPRVAVLKIQTPSSAKDFMKGSGYFDDGGAKNVDYTSQPVTFRVGSYSRTFTLTPNKKRTQFKFKDGELQFTLLPNFRKASLGIFLFKISKTPLGALLDTSNPLAFHFSAVGIPDATGIVRLTNNKYKRGTVRGDVFAPHIFPAHITGNLGGLNKDKLRLRVGFASQGTAPAVLGTVRVAFGKQFARTLAGSAFTKDPKKDKYTYNVTSGGSRFLLIVDYSNDYVSIGATNIELGPLSDDTTDFVFDAGDGQGAFRNTIHLYKNAKGTAFQY
jgi:DNA-binding beta-propeller fold protein YncE